MTDEFKKEIKKDLVDVKEVKKEPVEVKETKKKEEKKEELKKEVIKKEVKVINPNGYYVCSRLSHPTELSYQGKSFMLPSRGQSKIKDKDLLGNLPNGIYVREIY